MDVSWSIKKAEHWTIDAFELRCWRRLLRVPWTARRSNQFIPKELSPGCSLEGLMLKLQLQSFGHLMRRKFQPTPVLLPGKSHGQRSVVGYSPWGRKESDTTKWLHFHFDEKKWLIWKDPDAGKDWRREEKGTTVDEMVGQYHRLDGYEFAKLRELVMDREAWRAAFMGSQRVGHDWATELNWE